MITVSFKKKSKSYIVKEEEMLAMGSRRIQFFFNSWNSLIIVCFICLISFSFFFVDIDYIDYIVLFKRYNFPCISGTGGCYVTCGDECESGSCSVNRYSVIERSIGTVMCNTTK